MTISGRQMVAVYLAWQGSLMLAICLTALGCPR